MQTRMTKICVVCVQAIAFSRILLILRIVHKRNASMRFGHIMIIKSSAQGSHGTVFKPLQSITLPVSILVPNAHGPRFLSNIWNAVTFENQHTHNVLDE